MEIEMSVISCARCHVVFVIPAAMDKRLRDSHQSFFCPLGHPQSYSAVTELDLANREIKRLREINQDQNKRLEEQRKSLARKPAGRGERQSKRKGVIAHGTTKT